MRMKRACSYVAYTIKTLAGGYEKTAAGFKLNKDRLTLVQMLQSHIA